MRPTQLQQRLAAPERACAHCARPSVAPQPPRSVARRAEQPPGGQAGIAESSTQTAPGDVAAVAPEDLPLNASGPGVQPPNDSTYLEPFDFFKTALQLVTIQMVCGYAVTPALAAVAEELPLFGISVAPFLSQLLYIAAAGYVSRTALTRGGFSEPRGFFRYTSKPGLFAVGLAGTLLCVGVAVGIDNLDAVRAPSSTSTDLVQLLNGGAPLSMYFTGMTTGALTPWIEERVFRGFILQGLLPYVGAPGAVRRSPLSPLLCRVASPPR